MMEIIKTKEVLNPKSVVITTSTLYPQWTDDKTVKIDQSVQVRGGLAIEMIKQSVSRGYQVVVVDGGSGEEFINNATSSGATVFNQQEKGMSPSRRQAFREASVLKDCKIICWTEPEKTSLITDCLPKVLAPIINNEADIVIPKRDEAAFLTYPDFQSKYEKMANRMWSDLLRKYGLLPTESDDLDVFFGPRIFKNDPKMLSLFLARYEFNQDIPLFLKNVQPEDWTNATYLAIPAALNDGYKVDGSVVVPYRHPQNQTDLETDSDYFRQKRVHQLKSIVATTSEFLKLMKNNPKSLLHKVD